MQMDELLKPNQKRNRPMHCNAFLACATKQYYKSQQKQRGLDTYLQIGTEASTLYLSFSLFIYG